MTFQHTDIILVNRSNKLTFNNKVYRCAVGEAGFTDKPREGDKATPLGTYNLRECWYREDRVKKPLTGLPLKIIHEQDGWCDDPEHARYNRHVQLPFPASHENLWREEHVYDIIIPIGFNDDPVLRGKGSAIFMHIARPDYSPTLGCVALSLPDMLEILPALMPHTRITIDPAL